ncbi:Crp/Fnr family transcriptional regulator [Paucibacter sp. APW11]|uniref:Crp/Fnr family transcriptional regulator n=1 Tax=Roseateles aquae TaxID=3077235 RepID=A0ABU3PCS3_9BURK|nr:Crp/Fnr family transcriptional regulator [Paucibacter sp. APW11]MDT9000370.1 Crp/Fnr family transcriptional regulator [Paucibacter sp. APW11]
MQWNAAIVDSLNTSRLQAPRDAGVHGAAALEPAMPLNVDWQALLGGAALSASELQALQAMPAPRRLAAGSMAFTRRQRAAQLIAVLEGAVGLGLARDDEPFQLERTVRGPGWLDLSSAWLGEEHAQDARALEDSWLVELPLERVRGLLAREPNMLDRLLLALARAVHGLTCVTHDLMHKDAERRLAAWLLQHCEPVELEGKGEGVQVSLKERKRDIAAQLAITPETLSRMMRQLNRKGVIEVQGYKVKVLDLGSLRALAQD